MALIDEIRRKNPSLSSRSDDEIKSLIRDSPEFQYFSDDEFDAYVSGGSAAPQSESESAPGFTAGLAAGVDQLQGMGGGLLMAAGEALESESILNTGRDVYQRNMEEAAENDLGFGFTDIRGAGDAWQWARYTAGNLLPMMAASVAGGGVGGAAAGLTARTLAGAAAKEGARRAGQALGAWAASTGMETGAMMGETENLDVSLAHGALAGALDAVTPVRLLRSAGNRELADKAASEISDRVLNDLRRQASRSAGGAVRSGSLTNLIGEASTEGLQGLINQHANYWVENNGDTLLANLDQVDVKALIDEAAAGGLMGGLAGGPAGLGERRQARQQVQQIEAAREQAAAQGGDALDQTMAAQEAEQSAEPEREPVDPTVSAEVGNRLQLAMGELDDLQNLARGSSYQGQTRLRNISTILDRAERAFEEGNVEQARRLTERADGIARNLRSALEREGSDERPARREGEIVEGEEGMAPQGPAGLLGMDGRRLPPGDPNTIFAGGPTADQTQYDPQARTVRRDEGLAAQRQGSERLREQVAGQRPQIPDQGIIYGEGPAAGNANTGLDQPFERARFTDTGAATDAQAARAQQQQNADDVARLARTRGRGETAYLPDNTPVRTRFRVVEAAELRPSNTPDGRVNPDYPQELQPRDRTNANSQVQVRNIAARLNPERLGSSRDAGTGAPIIGNDGVVESGNGRTMAITQAYQQGGDRAQAYRDFVRREAEAQGIDPAAVDEMAQPVLVRERVGDIDRADFARRANESQVAGMTAYEQAMADADSLTADDLQVWSPDQGGDPLAASNRDFQRAFVQRLGNNEAARYTTRGGQASPELGQRMQRAVFAKAYQDADMVEMATEQGDQMRNLTAALQVAAPDLAIARETGSQDALDAIGTINDAARIVRQSRQDGISVRELTRQADAFSDPVPETTALLAVAMHNNLRSRRALSEGMRYIGQAVRTRAENERNGALFEDTTTNEDVFNAAFQEDSTQRAEQRSPQGAVQPGAERGQRQPAEGRQAETAAGAEAGRQADPVDADPLLATYDEQELAEREQVQRQAEQAEAEQRRQKEQRAQADAEADDFRLAGSDRPADVMAAGGQQDLADAQLPAQDAPTQRGAEQQDAQSGRIEDFGERIAGARKDQVNQVMASLETEVTGTTTLSEAFPAPNYTKLIEEGVDSRAAAFVAVIRNSIPAKPRKAFRLRQWMQQLEQAQGLVRQLLGGDVTFDQMLERAGSPQYRQVEGALRTAELIAPLKPSLYSKAAKWRVDAHAGYSIYDGQKMDPNQTVYALRDERGRLTGVWATDFEAIREQAANVITSAVEKDDSKPKSRQTPINVYHNARTGDRFIAFQVGSRKIRLVGGFESASAAADYITENRDQLQQQIDAMRAGPRMRNDGNAPREGVELRDGDVTPDDFQAAFGFRGVQFGNYVEGQRRQADLNQAYDALMDLATMLGVPPKAMSLDGTLGLAFGARGKGGRRSAAAHYEPGQVVINLTKTQGPGSLAHEWFHALDNFIPHGQGRRHYQTDLATDGPARAELAERWREMRQALKDSGFEKRSKEFDEPRSKPYFGTPIEMAARAFERYTKGKLEERGVRNDYLVNIDSDPEGPYPTDAEMAAIGPAFDRLMGTLEHRETARGVELYSLNPSGEALKPAPRAEDIASALEGIDELGDARVIQSARELPPEALLGMAIRGVNPRDVRGMYIGGDLYVVADNVESVQEGVRTAVHEAVGHKGMRAVLGADLERVMLNLYRNLPNSKEGRDALREVRRDYPFLDPSKREDRITIGEEMVAHLLEKGHRPKAWQRAVAKIRELLRRLFPSVAWTYTDALALGEKSRDYLRRQQAERQGDTGELYSLRGKQRAALESQFDDFTDADRAAAAKIGARTPPQRAMEWFKEKADRAGLKIRQGMVDRVAALKELDEQLYGESALGENITRSSWVLARMSNAANGALHALLHNGRIKLDADQKVITLQEGDAKGLGEVLGRLGSAAEIERFMGWIAGNRAARLAGEGRENLFDMADIEAMQGWNRGQMADGRSREAVYREVFEEFQAYRDDVLAVAEQSGIISKEQREMWAEEFYVPFYRLAEDNNGQVSGMMATSGLSRQQAYKRLKGGTQNLNDLLQNTMMNFHHLLDASLKNQAAVQAVENAKQLGMVEKVPESNRDTKKSTFVMEGGKKVFYEIDDPLVFQALTALAHPGMNSTAMKVMRGFKRVFTNLTTTTPQFMVANLIRDSLQAVATNNVSKNAFKNVIEGAGSYRDQRIRAQMMASGASFNFGHLYGNNPDELRSQLTRNMRDAKLVDGPYAVPNVLRAGWAWWNDVNNAAENLNRAAIYAQNREGGELRAAFEARDLIDFSAHGAWPAVRILIDIVPFLNARIQGLDKIYRSGVKPGASVVAEAFGYGKAGVTEKQAAARFWTVTGALAAATIALYLHNQDDEEFQKLEDWQKDTYWFFRAGDQAFFIPKPFEVGAIATMAERITEQFTDDQATGKLFRQRMMHMMTNTFSFSPVPQAVQPALDIYANYDAFTQRPIESMGMDRLSPELRVRSSTSQVARWISSALNSTVGAIGNPDRNPLALSPVQIDHLIGGYFGQIGTWVASSGDIAWRAATGEQAPARRWYEYQPVRRFYRNLGDEDVYTRYGTIFYEGLREAGRAHADVKELREMGRLADAAERADSNREMLALRLPLNRAQSRLRSINQQIDIIRRSNLDGEVKRQRIDRLRAVKNQIQRALGERVLEARAG